MRFFLFFITFLLAIFIERIIGGMATLFTFSPPIIVAFILFWFWDIPVFWRMVLGLAMGAVLDTLSVYPFGTYTLTFFLTALLTELLHTIFSEIHSPITRGVGTAILLFLFFPLRLFLGVLMGWIGTIPYTISFFLIRVTFLAAFIWTLIYLCIFFSVRIILTRRRAV